MVLSYSQYICHNKLHVQASTECGCVYCLGRINPADIDEYTADDSAICPNCGIDTIVPNSLIQYTSEDLRRWHIEGFTYTDPDRAQQESHTDWNDESDENGTN